MLKYRCQNSPSSILNPLEAHPRLSLSARKAAELVGNDVPLECSDDGKTWKVAGVWKWDARIEDWGATPDFGE